EQHAAVDEKDILPRALADHAVGPERDRFVVAVGERLHLDELTAEIVAGDLRHRGDGVRRDAVPARHAGVDPLLQRAFAEVGPPRPAGEIYLDRARERHHAGRAVAADDHRADIAGVEAIAV